MVYAKRKRSGPINVVQNISRLKFINQLFWVDASTKPDDDY